MKMFAKKSLDEHCRKILEEKGGKIADKARTILLKEKSLMGLRRPLEYISENWRDPATPSLIILSCEAVGGKPDKVIHQVALAMTLMNLSLNLWDDLVDRTTHKGFVPTVFGKFGEGVTLIIGGLASAKAFSILSEMRVDKIKRQTTTRLVWNCLEKLAKAETTDLELIERRDVKPEEKLRLIEMQAVSLETSSKIGAFLGNGSEDEIKHLGNYGKYLSIILDLKKDFNESVNLTFELAKKIRSGTLPYTLLWARNRSNMIREYLPLLTNDINHIDIKKIVEAILETKALENTLRLLKALEKRAETELIQLKSNKSTTTLRFFLEAQSKIFVESLSTL